MAGRLNQGVLKDYRGNQAKEGINQEIGHIEPYGSLPLSHNPIWKK